MYFAEDALADAERAQEAYRLAMEKLRACVGNIDGKIYDESSNQDFVRSGALLDEVQTLACDAQEAIGDYLHAMEEYRILTEGQKDANPPDSIWSLGLVGMF